MKKAVFILILLTTGLSVKSQKNFNGFSLNPEIGLDIFSEDLVPVYPAAKVNYYHNNFIFSAFYTYEGVFFPSTQNYDYNYFDLLFGEYIDKNMFRFKFQTGAGIIFGNKRGKLKEVHKGMLSNTYIYETKTYVNFDMPLHLGISFIPCKYCAVGTDINFNLNSEKMLAGIAISLELGLIKE